MPRQRMVSRTIKTTEVTVKTADLITNTIEEKNLLIIGEYTKDSLKLPKALSKQYPDIHILSIEATTINGELYSVPENEFIELAMKYKESEES